MRVLLVTVKLFLNRIRQFANVYNVLLAVFPSKKIMARALGSVIAQSCRIRGSVKLFEPAWFQMNSGSTCGSINMKNNSFLLIDHNGTAGDLDISIPTIITADSIYSCPESGNVHVTVSVDLEGGVGLSHASKEQFNELRPQWDSQSASYALYSLFKKYSIPVTWAVCGHLFLESCNGKHGFDELDWYGDWFTHDPMTDAKKNQEWYMPDFIRTLRDDETMEIGYHSFGHFNYRKARTATILKDLEWATTLRRQWNIPLTTMVFPYNAISHLSEAIAHGFTTFRGYIGQYYLPTSVNFGSFTLFGTSMFLSPRNIKNRIRHSYECIGRNFNFFLHPEDWVGNNLHLFEEWCIACAALRDSGQIVVKTLGYDEKV